MRSMALALPAGFQLERHTHGWPQLLSAESGALRVQASDATWVLPASLAAWLPPRREHALTAIGPTSLRTLYLSPELARPIAGDLRVVRPSDLLRAMVGEACARGNLFESVAEDARLAAVLLDQIAAARTAPLRIAMPRDVRARRVAEQVLRAPSLRLRLERLARGSGASARTLERRFAQETGSSFARWRQQACLIEAVQRLSTGSGVGEVAHALGYSTPSAFIAMFRASLGVTPARYAREG